MVVKYFISEGTSWELVYLVGWVLQFWNPPFSSDLKEYAMLLFQARGAPELNPASSQIDINSDWTDQSRNTLCLILLSYGYAGTRIKMIDTEIGDPN